MFLLKHGYLNAFSLFRLIDFIFFKIFILDKNFDFDNLIVEFIESLLHLFSKLVKYILKVLNQNLSEDFEFFIDLFVDKFLETINELLSSRLLRLIH